MDPPIPGLSIGYIKPRPSVARFRKVLSELLPKQSDKLRAALAANVRAPDWTLTETEISIAADPKWPTKPNPGGMRLLYGKFAHALSDELGISDQPLRSSWIDEDGVLWRSRASPSDPNIWGVRDNWIRGIAAASRDETGEWQWTLFPEIVRALLPLLKIRKAGQVSGRRLPDWALDELEIPLPESLSGPVRPRPDTGEVDSNVQPPNLGGAGFGDYQSNKKVERAASDFVKRKYRRDGWDVVSFEDKKGVGYDLRCTRGKEERHIEVKGNSRSGLKFIITKTEKDRAASDPLFRLALVTDALSARKRRLQEWPQQDFLQEFDFVVKDYWAEYVGKTRKK